VEDPLYVFIDISLFFGVFWVAWSLLTRASSPTATVVNPRGTCDHEGFNVEVHDRCPRCDQPIFWLTQPSK